MDLLKNIPDTTTDSEKEFISERLSIHVCPIRAIKEDFFDDCRYILCTEWSYEEFEEKSNILLLRFADTEMEDHPRAFSNEMATEIVEFVRGYTGDVFVCCDSGESRSSAIAAALMKCFGQNECEIWESNEYHPNMLVYERMIERIMDLGY